MARVRQENGVDEVTVREFKKWLKDNKVKPDAILNVCVDSFTVSEVVDAVVEDSGAEYLSRLLGEGEQTVTLILEE